LKLNLKPWDKEQDTKMQRMLSGNPNANPVAVCNIDISINKINTPNVNLEEEGNTFREHMSYRKKILALMNSNF